jgi:regulator of protease activity HflC (stomatin/prohibitin superfamily)
MQKRINEAEGEAQEILRVANATAEGIRQIARATQEPGGIDAVSLRIAQRYLEEFGRLARTNTTMIIPTDLSDVAGVVGSLGKVFERLKTDGGSAAPALPPRR